MAQSDAVLACQSIRSAATIRDLPMPGSPTTIRPPSLALEALVKGDLVVAADERCQFAPCIASKRLSVKRPTTQARTGSVPFAMSEVNKIEEVADKSAGTGRDDYAAGLGQRLKAGSQIRRFTDHGRLLGSAFADEITDDDRASSNANTRGERFP